MAIDIVLGWWLAFKRTLASWTASRSTRPTRTFSRDRTGADVSEGGSTLRLQGRSCRWRQVDLLSPDVFHGLRLDGSRWGRLLAPAVSASRVPMGGFALDISRPGCFPPWDALGTTSGQPVGSTSSNPVDGFALDRPERFPRVEPSRCRGGRFHSGEGHVRLRQGDFLSLDGFHWGEALRPTMAGGHRGRPSRREVHLSGQGPLSDGLASGLLDPDIFHRGMRTSAAIAVRRAVGARAATLDPRPGCEGQVIGAARIVDSRGDRMLAFPLIL